MIIVGIIDINTVFIHSVVSGKTEHCLIRYISSDWKSGQEKTQFAVSINKHENCFCGNDGFAHRKEHLCQQLDIPASVNNGRFIQSFSPFKETAYRKLPAPG